MIEETEIQDEMKEVLNEEVEETTESVEVEEVAEGEPTDKPKPKKYNKPASKVIGKMRWQLGEADREIASLKEKLEAKASPQVIKRPNEDDFSTNEEYQEASSSYHEEDKKAYAAQAIKEHSAKLEADREQESKATQRNQESDNWMKQVKITLENEPDFKEKELEFMEDVKHLGATHLFEDLLSCDNGVKIVSSLHGDYEKLEKIAKMSPKRASKAIWELDKTYSKTRAKNPPPPTRESRPSGSGSSVGKKKLSQYDANRKFNGFT